MTPPVLETLRLRLRGHRPEDLSAAAAMWADVEITRFIGGKPFTREDVWGRILRYVGHWNWMGYGYWLVEDKESGRFIGEVGFADLKRNIVPTVEEIPEIGWVLSRECHGQGYATEAAKAAVAWADEQFRGAQTVCIIHPDNAQSLAVAKKCGYQEFARTTYKEQEAILFTRARA